MIIGVCGPAGSGKDTFSDFLVNNHGFVKISFADKIKQICRDVFDFSDEQLWGSSSKRNEPDERYIRYTSETAGPQYLTPRHALQQLGTNWGRSCYKNVWAENTIRVAQQLLSAKPEEGMQYDRRYGMFRDPMCAPIPAPNGIVISDVRFLNEVTLLRNAGAKIVRLYRGTSLREDHQNHESEQELNTIPTAYFDASVHNNNSCSLEDLEVTVCALYRAFKQSDLEGVTGYSGTI